MAAASWHEILRKAQDERGFRETGRSAFDPMEGKPMKYANGQTITVGDQVMVDGMAGVVVCDFDGRKFADGYQDWDMPSVEMLGGGTLDSGIMVNTAAAGLIHYPPGSGIIEFVRAG